MKDLREVREFTMWRYGRKNVPDRGHTSAKALGYLSPCPDK
jgi:hypothetical protein